MVYYTMAQNKFKNVKLVNKGIDYNPLRKEVEKDLYLYNKLNENHKEGDKIHKLTTNMKDSSELVFKVVEAVIKDIPNNKFHLALTYTTKYGRFTEYVGFDITKYNGINDIKKIFQDYDEYLRSKMQKIDKGMYDLAISISYKQ